MNHKKHDREGQISIVGVDAPGECTYESSISNNNNRKYFNYNNNKKKKRNEMSAGK